MNETSSLLDRVVGRFIIHLALVCAGIMLPLWIADASRAQSAEEREYSIEIVDEKNLPIADANADVLVRTEIGVCPTPEVGSLTNLFLLLANPEVRKGRSGEVRIPCAIGKCQMQTRAQVTEATLLIAGIADDYAPEIRQLGKSPRIRIKLTKVPSLNIRVQKEGGQPVTSAQVRLVPLSMCFAHVSSFRDLLMQPVTTDSNGVAVIKSIADGAYAIGIQRNGQMAVSTEPVIVALGKRDIVLSFREAAMKPFQVSLPPSAKKEDRAVVFEYGARPDSGMLLSAQAAPGQKQVTFMIPEGVVTPRNLFGIQQDGHIFSVEGVTGSQSLGNEQSDVPIASGQTISMRKLPERLAGKIRSLFVWNKSRVLVSSVAEVDIRETKVSATGPLMWEQNQLMSRVTMMGAAGYGSVQISPMGRNGEVSLPAGQTLYGDVTWDTKAPIVHGVLRISSEHGPICELMTSSSGNFICSYQGPQDVPMDYSILVEGQIIHLKGHGAGGELHLSPRQIQEESSFVRIEEGKTGETVDEVAVWPSYRELNSGDDGLIMLRLYAHTNDGRIPATLLSPGSGDILIGHPDSSPGGMRNVNTMRMRASGKTSIRLAGTGSIAGTLLEKGSKHPIEEALIELRSEGPFNDFFRIGRGSVTDSRGKWTLASVPGGQYRISVSAPGYKNEFSVIDVVPGREIALIRELIPVGALHGTVSGLSPNSTVNVQVLNDGKGDIEVRNLGNYETYEFREIPVGQYPVQARVVPGDDGKGGLQLVKVTISAGQLARADFDFGSGIALSGHAFIGKEAVKLKDIGFEMAASEKELIYKPTRTDNEGYFSVILPRPGDYTASFAEKGPRGGGKSSVTVVVFSVKEQRADLHFSKAGLAGKVIDQGGTPLGHSRIRLWSNSEGNRPIVGSGGSHSRLVVDVTNSEDGSFLLSPVAPGPYQLEIAAEGFKNKLTEPISLAADEIVDVHDIIMEPSSTFAVRVMDQLGSAIAGVNVVAFEDGDLLRSGYPPAGISAANGLAKLKGIGTREYTIIAMAKGFAPSFLEIDRSASERQNDLPQEIVMVPGSPVEIMVLDTSGRPKGGFRVGIRDTTGRDVTRVYENLALISNETTETNSEGYLRFSSVATGQYRIFLLNQEAFSTQIVTVGDSDSGEARVLLTEPPKK